MSLNSELDQVIVEVKLFAVAQGMTERKAFQVALKRFAKRWAAQQTVPGPETQALQDACDGLVPRLGDFRLTITNAVATVAANHQSEVDAIVNGTNIPE